MTELSRCPTCGTPGTPRGSGFLSLPPLRVARRYADAELGNKATAEQVRWLHEHSLLWLRALVQIERDVEVHIAKDRSDLAALKPRAGTSPSKEYLVAKFALDERSTKRLHFRRMVERRKEEVRSMFGTDRSVTRAMAGDLLGEMAKIADMAEQDDIDGIMQVAHAFINRWGAELAKQEKTT